MSAMCHAKRSLEASLLQLLQPQNTSKLGVVAGTLTASDRRAGCVRWWKVGKVVVGLIVALS